MKALVYRRFGAPLDVLQVIEQDLANPDKHEIIVDVLASPIDPMDLLMIRGLYPMASKLPAIPGAEGVARVVSCGAMVRDLVPGDLVLMPIRSGAWCTQARLLESETLRLPKTIDVVQASMLRVNGLTARAMLETNEKLSAGEWVVQSLGTSSVGQYVVQWAKKLGLRTVSLVRSRERAQFLLDLGADVVIEINRDTVAEVKTMTGGADIRLGFDGHGGLVTELVAECLGRGGLVLCYGAMSREAARLSVAQSVFRGIRLQGFWLFDWIQQLNVSGKPCQNCVDQYLLELLQEKLTSRVDSLYSLDSFRDAFSRVQQSEVQGRVLFCPTEL